MENDIVHQSPCVATPQQNGIAEWKNRHLLEVARSLMFTNGVPKQFWGESILTAAYLINRMPTRIFNFQSPLNVFTEFYPTAKVFTSLPPKFFGCIAFVHVHTQNRSKLDPRALKCVFHGYLLLKNATNVMIYCLKNSSSQWMSHFFSQNFSSGGESYLGRSVRE